MDETCRNAYDSFLNTVKTDLPAFIEQMNYSEIEKAADLIVEAQKNGGRVHISGIGKPGHISGYIASLLSSTGNPTYFLHGTEAVHGSCGQGGPLDRAPRMSILAETLVLQALSVVLQAHKAVSPKQYVKWHPGGSLGKLRDSEK